MRSATRRETRKVLAQKVVAVEGAAAARSLGKMRSLPEAVRRKKKMA